MSNLLQEAIAAHNAGRLDIAVAAYRAILHEHPGHAAHNLGVALTALGRTQDAEAAYRLALQQRPDQVLTKHNLATLLLARGAYAEAWPLHEARRWIPGSTTANPLASKNPPRCPEWRGEDLDGKRIVVFGEQGFGDQIMFARFLDPLRTRGAEVVYVCAPALTGLFPGSIPGVQGHDLPDSDYWTLLGSIPLQLGTSLETLPPPVALQTSWPDGRSGIGVVTRGSPAHANDRNRSLDPAAAGELSGLGRDLHPDATGARDFSATANIVAGLDLVITVDTSMAHLAGSLGKPTWVLLPAIGVDWRWLRGRTDSPWYPSVRLFRQARPGDWQGVIQDVRRALDSDAARDPPRLGLRRSASSA